MDSAGLKAAYSYTKYRAGSSGLQTGILAIHWFMGIPRGILGITPSAVRAIKLNLSEV
jgi:hypothetical protein